MTARARRHMARVRSLPCILCDLMGMDDSPAELHHIFDTAARSDFLTIPLCAEHHRGKTGFHGLGQRAFEGRYGTTEANLLAMTLERLA